MGLRWTIGAAIAAALACTACGAETRETESGEEGGGSGGGRGDCQPPESIPIWQPPLGIPRPPFGIDQQAPLSPSPWNQPVAGYYYVDASGSCDDGSRGHPALPRCTIPRELEAGSVVELHGAYAASHTSPNTISAYGTEDAPVFIRGVGANDRPLVTNGWEVGGSGYVIENIEFAFGEHQGRLVMWGTGAALRHSEIRGTLYNGGVYAEGSGVLLWDNHIHDGGDWQNMLGIDDQDVHGILIGGATNGLWVLDNIVYHHSGDGLQINGTNDGTRYVFVGRNELFDNKQTGFWTKYASDVVFSENVAHGHRASSSSEGACAGYQYGPERLWFLFNRLYDCEYGIAGVSDSGPIADAVPGRSHFFINNVIHDIRQHTNPDTTLNPYKSGAAFSFRSSADKLIANNTIYDVEVGVAVQSTQDVIYLVNNLFGAVAAEHVIHAGGARTMDYSIFDGPARLVWGDNTPRDLAAFRAAHPAQCVQHCLEVDPVLVDPSNGDFHIGAASPAIDVGLDLVELTNEYRALYGAELGVDIDGDVRPSGANWDIGADERVAGHVSDPCN